MKTIILLLLLLLPACTLAQTRIYLAVGINSQTKFQATPNFNLGLANNNFSLGAFLPTDTWKYPRLEINVEKRMSGSLYWLSGLSFSQSGFVWDYGFGATQFKTSYLSVPLLLRYNFGNSHVLYFDLGLIENYLANADLSERFYQLSDERNIAPHLTRFSTTFSFQFNIVINRFIISTYSITQNWASSRDFSTEWNLPRNQSFFLLYCQRFYHTATGLKLSYRLR